MRKVFQLGCGTLSLSVDTEKESAEKRIPISINLHFEQQNTLYSKYESQF